MKGNTHLKSLLFCCFNLLAWDAIATHLRAAEIQVERVNCAQLTFQIKVIVYLDSKSTTPFGGVNLTDGNITFGDGAMVLIPTTPATLRPDLGPDIAIASFTTTHTYATPGVYKINYYERDRSAGVLNMIESEETAYSSSITVNTEAAAGCNRFPRLTIPPVDKACSGIVFSHNAGAFDPDGDSLSYAIVIPEQNIDVDVAGYVPVDDPKFYLNYNTSNETGTGPPDFSIDPITGLITWDAPGIQGQYNIAFEIIEWRKISNQWIKLSTTVRDMQIIVSECDNVRPGLNIPNDICIEAGKTITATITGFDPEYDSIKIEPFSEVFSLATSPATFTPSDIKFRKSSPPATLEFKWTTTCRHIREQSYQVVFKITDKPEIGTTLTTFKTWNIRIIAPKPKWKNAKLDVENRSASLEWNDYSCNNASAIQIWRKVDGVSYSPKACETGIPGGLGYTLIKTVGVSEMSFRDNNSGKALAVGARYCYRLVAVFDAPAGGKSYVSEEICIGPIVADAPIITHVTVDKTADQDGSIRVSWRSPIKINTDQFPKPYKYKVLRATGFSGDHELTPASDLVDDTTFLDAGPKTAIEPYNYRIVVYTKFESADSYLPFDTSSMASSVWLHAVAGPKKIDLDWSASVPWSNVVQNWPWHLIYRGSDGSGTLTLIDSVDVFKDGFRYVDDGRYNNQPLDGTKLYCYAIITRGTYGNPIVALLENASQRVCLNPVSNIIPCKPTLSVALTSCDQFITEEACDIEDFENDLEWEPDIGPGCRQDIVSYNLYASDNQNATIALIASGIKDHEYVDTGLSSYARCYRVTAVDSQGQESELSDLVCNDNCPYFELPNVFTPNGDGCNDRFSAYRPEDEATCDTEIMSRCPKFVEKVSFKVFNRWGNEVYKFESGDGHSVNIDWDGRDDSGSMLDAAVYYYNADVVFATTDPLKRTKTIRGWVQLVR